MTCSITSGRKNANTPDAPAVKIPRSTLYLLAANSTPDALRDELVRRVEAGEPPMTHSELKSRVEENASETVLEAGPVERANPKHPTSTLREQILAASMKQPAF
jgi:hypothetical protein